MLNQLFNNAAGNAIAESPSPAWRSGMGGGDWLSQAGNSPVPPAPAAPNAPPNMLDPRMKAALEALIAAREQSQAQAGLPMPKAPEKQNAKFGSKDLLTGLLPLALMMISGKKGGELAAGFIPGYLQGKTGETERKYQNDVNKYNMSAMERERQDKIAENRIKMAQQDIDNLSGQEKLKQDRENLKFNQQLRQDQLKESQEYHDETAAETKRNHDLMALARTEDDYSKTLSLKGRQQLRDQYNQIAQGLGFPLKSDEQVLADYEPIKEKIITDWDKNHLDPIIKRLGGVPDSEVAALEKARNSYIKRFGLSPEDVPEIRSFKTMLREHEERIMQENKDKFAWMKDQRLKDISHREAQAKASADRLASIDRRAYATEYNREWDRYYKAVREWKSAVGGAAESINVKLQGAKDALAAFRAANPPLTDLQRKKGMSEDYSVTQKRNALLTEVAKLQGQYNKVKENEKTIAIPQPVPPSSAPPDLRPQAQQQGMDRPTYDKRVSEAQQALSQGKITPQRANEIFKWLKDQAGVN